MRSELTDSMPCRTHGALADYGCGDCRGYAAWIFSHGYPEEPMFEEWARGVLDCLERIDRGATPMDVRLWLEERRAEEAQRGVILVKVPS